MITFFSLVIIIIEHTKSIANKSNYYNVLSYYIHYVRTIMDHYDIYAIYHLHIITDKKYHSNLTQLSSLHKTPILYNIP